MDGNGDFREAVSENLTENVTVFSVRGGVEWGERKGGFHMEPILQVESLKKYYGRDENLTKALDGVSFQVLPGEFLGIMGSSGSGKSTLLHCLATIVKPTEGSIRMEGRELRTMNADELSAYRGKKTGYLFQNFELLENLTGRENILLPLSLHGVPERESEERLKRLSEYLDITDVGDKFPSQMSGGQKQRVAAARAMILDPAIVFADEPTGALDSKNARILMERLAHMNEAEGTTVLMVTHDSLAASFCHRILLIRDGKILQEIRRDTPRESREDFYRRILKVMAVVSGGDPYVP